MPGARRLDGGRRSGTKRVSTDTRLRVCGHLRVGVGLLHGLGTQMPPGWPEEQVRLVGIVRAAAQLDVLRGGPAARGIEDDVMEFHERALSALPTVSADEGTT